MLARGGIGIRLQFGPTGEPLFPGEDKLCVMQSHKLAHDTFGYRCPAPMVSQQAAKSVSISRTDGSQKIACLPFLIFEIQDDLLRMPGPHDRRKRVNEEWCPRKGS